MSRDKIKQITDNLFVWATRLLLAANVWILSEVYRDIKADFQKTKEDVHVLQVNDRSQDTAIEFLKDQLKARR
jgi:hypothetical protein